MKRLKVCLFLWYVFVLGELRGQNVCEESMFLYYMPLNSIVFNIHYEESVQKRGEFQEYAKSLLGLNHSVAQNMTSYNLLSLDYSIATSPDYDRPFWIKNDAGEFVREFLCFTDDGRLLGYNIEPFKKESLPLDLSVNAPLNNRVPLISPASVINEEYVHNVSNKQKAKLVADEIFRLREAKMYIISGESEHYPTEYKALELTLNKLEQQETQLLELFTGTTTITQKSIAIPYVPHKTESKILFYFNKYKGIIEANKLTSKSVDDIPVMLSTKVICPFVKSRDDKKKQRPPKDSPNSELYYNIPGRLQFKLYSKDTVFVEGEVIISQLGVAVPFRKNLLNTENVRIYIHPQTGYIESINH